MGEHISYIVSRIREGDARLFEAIYTENYYSLVAYARRFVISEEEARGVIQDVFIRMWEKRESLPRDLQIKNYLYASVRNRCLDILKHRRNVNRFLEEKIREVTQRSLNIPQGKEDPLEAIITRETEERIIAAIDTLPPRCKEVFRMSRFEKMKNKEIAQHLGLSVKTVESHISHALSVLRTLLRED
jgi:RNA polymerase sigma-70 factor (ECF subfamily)